MCNIANIYLLTQDQIKSASEFLQDLDKFAEGIVLMGWDFSFALNPDLHSTVMQGSITK